MRARIAVIQSGGPQGSFVRLLQRACRRLAPLIGIVANVRGREQRVSRCKVRVQFDGPVQQFGDPATLLLTETTREVRVGDRLLPMRRTGSVTHFQPHAAPAGTEGRIISVIDGVTEIGPYNVVAINRGTREGMETGHVLKIYQSGKVVRDEISGKRNDKVKLPDEEAGIMMVFSVFEKVSLGLVMEAHRAIHINDIVRTP